MVMTNMTELLAGKPCFENQGWPARHSARPRSHRNRYHTNITFNDVAVCEVGKPASVTDLISYKVDGVGDICGIFEKGFTVKNDLLTLL